MINRKPTQCYLCRETIQRGQTKRKHHGINYAHTECKRVKKSKSWFASLLNKFK